MTDTNTSQPAPTTNPTADATSTNVDRRNNTIHIIVAFIIGAILAGLIVGAVAFIHPNSSSSTRNNNVTVAADNEDTCDATFTVVASVNQWGSLAQQGGSSHRNAGALINQ